MENYTFNFKNEQAKVVYQEYVSYLRSENIPADIQKNFCVGFIEALNRLGFLTRNEYSIVKNPIY